MKNTLYIYILAVLALTLSACDSKIQPDEVFDDETTVCFMPELGSISPTDIMPDSYPASRTKAAELVSADGSVCIPLYCSVSDGIADQYAAPETKGSLKNTGTTTAALNNFGFTSFKMAAWLGSTKFVPANTTVSFSSGEWKTSSTYKWTPGGVSTFYAYANLPASGATVATSGDTAQTLEYSAVPTSASAQTDILMGFYKGSGEYDSTLKKGGIAKIAFYHPLTAIRFQFGDFNESDSSPISTVVIKKITIKGVHANGTLTMTAAANSSDIFSWEVDDELQDITLGDGTSALSVDSSNSIIGGDDGAFLIIPQSLSAYPISFHVDAYLGDSAEYTPLIATLSSGTWEAGKTYTYTLNHTKE